MKYARIERERRFLLTRVPGDLPGVYRKITDQYLDGTRFRLRQIVDTSNTIVALKLTQKYREPDARPSCCTITNSYLNQAEFESFQTLGGRILQKRRFVYDVDGVRFAIDVFQGELSGLVLAEVEFDDDAAMDAMTLPSFADSEVTDDPFFTGGNLCCVRADDLRRKLGR